jgi:hypothetical protein
MTKTEPQDKVDREAAPDPPVAGEARPINA